MGRIWILAAAILLAGCMSDENKVLDRWLPNHDVSQTSAAGAGMSTDTEVNIPDGVGPDEYVQMALERNPTIVAAQRRVQRMAARIPQVTSLEDPMLQVTTIGKAWDGSPTEVMPMLSQKLPFPGKLSAEGDMAEQEVAQMAAELAQARLDVTAEVRQAYWSYYLATQSIAVTHQTRELLRNLQEIAETRFRSGSGAQADVLRASVEWTELESDLFSLEQQRTSAMGMLNSLVNRPVTAALPAPQPAELRQVELHLDTLLREAAAANPELRKIQHRIEAEKVRERLANLQRLPDVTIGAGYNFMDEEAGAMGGDEENDEWTVGVGINLPIWFDKYRAAQREALRGRQEAIADLAAAQNRVAFRVQDVVTRVQTQQRVVRLFADTILRQARQTVDVSRSGYQAGQVDFLMLTDNSRKLLEFELMYHQSLSQLQKDLAELEQVVGRQVEHQRAESNHE